MDDQDIHDRIEAIEAEEARLRADEGARSGEGDSPAIAADRERLAQLQAELEGLYARLRRRRALRNAGEDPDGA